MAINNSPGCEVFTHINAFRSGIGATIAATSLHKFFVRRTRYCSKSVWLDNRFHKILS